MAGDTALRSGRWTEIGPAAKGPRSRLPPVLITSRISGKANSGMRLMYCVIGPLGRPFRTTLEIDDKCNGSDQCKPDHSCKHVLIHAPNIPDRRQRVDPDG